MCGARPMRIIERLGLEQFGVRENDAELIVQAMKQCAEIAGFGNVHAMVDHRHNPMNRLQLNLLMTVQSTPATTVGATGPAVHCPL